MERKRPGTAPSADVCIRAGNRVDVLAAPNYDYNGQTIFEVKTVVQNALVLAAGKSIQNEVPTRVRSGGPVGT